MAHDTATYDERLDEMIDRIINEYKRLGYAQDWICSRSFDIEDEAAERLAANR